MTLIYVTVYFLISYEGIECFNSVYMDIVCHTEGIWRWPDGSLMVMPSDTWGVWYEGQPDDFKGAEDCLVMTNYMYWDTRQRILDFYVWRDYGCNFNPANEIQGYVCESKFAHLMPCKAERQYLTV